MNLLEAMKERHSVRSFTDTKIEGEVFKELQKTISECNQESGLNIQLCLDEPKAFSGVMARYGKFSNVKNYIALIGKKDNDLEEKCGYYGEKIVLKAQQLGLHTCWVALSYKKSRCAAIIHPGEKLQIVIAVGYGSSAGTAHKTKPMEKISSVKGEMPEWFRNGIEAVQLAPTAMNQQKFHFLLENNRVKAEPGSGFYTKLDLGIAKYHFEIGAADNSWEWAEH